MGWWGPKERNREGSKANVAKRNVPNDHPPVAGLLNWGFDAPLGTTFDPKKGIPNLHRYHVLYNDHPPLTDQVLSDGR